MTFRICLAAALILPALAEASPTRSPDYSAMVVAAQADPAQAASLWDAFCKGSTPTPQYICDQIKAAEKPILRPISRPAVLATN